MRASLGWHEGMKFLDPRQRASSHCWDIGKLLSLTNYHFSQCCLGVLVAPHPHQHFILKDDECRMRICISPITREEGKGSFGLLNLLCECACSYPLPIFLLHHILFLIDLKELFALDTNPLSVILVENIFDQFVACLFTLFRISFVEQKFTIIMYSWPLDNMGLKCRGPLIHEFVQ